MNTIDVMLAPENEVDVEIRYIGKNNSYESHFSFPNSLDIKQYLGLFFFTPFYLK